MKNRKFIYVLLSSMLATSILFSGCGKKQEEQTTNEVVQEKIERPTTPEKEVTVQDNSSSEVVEKEEEQVVVGTTQAEGISNQTEETSSESTVSTVEESSSSSESANKEQANTEQNNTSQQSSQPLAPENVENNNPQETVVETVESRLVEVYGSKENAEKVYSSDQLSAKISGNTISYSYTYSENLTEDEKKIVAEEINSAFKDLSSDYAKTLKEVEKTTGVSGAKMVIVYNDKDGKELTRIEIDANGIK